MNGAEMKLGAVDAMAKTEPEDIARKRIALTLQNLKRLDILKAIYADELASAQIGNDLDAVVNMIIERHYKSDEVQRKILEL